MQHRTKTYDVLLVFCCITFRSKLPKHAKQTRKYVLVVICCRKNFYNTNTTIVATYKKQRSEGIAVPDTGRLVSGVLLRGPNHSRKPTDRISFLTIEFLKANNITEEFIEYLPTANSSGKTKLNNERGLLL